MKRTSLFLLLFVSVSPLCAMDSYVDEHLTAEHSGNDQESHDETMRRMQLELGRMKEQGLAMGRHLDVQNQPVEQTTPEVLSGGSRGATSFGVDPDQASERVERRNVDRNVTRGLTAHVDSDTGKISFKNQDGTDRKRSWFNSRSTNDHQEMQALNSKRLELQSDMDSAYRNNPNMSSDEMAEHLARLQHINDALDDYTEKLKNHKSGWFGWGGLSDKANDARRIAGDATKDYNSFHDGLRNKITSEDRATESARTQWNVEQSRFETEHNAEHGRLEKAHNEKTSWGRKVNRDNPYRRKRYVRPKMPEDLRIGTGADARIDTARKQLYQPDASSEFRDRQRRAPQPLDLLSGGEDGTRSVEATGPKTFRGGDISRGDQFRQAVSGGFGGGDSGPEDGGYVSDRDQLGRQPITDVGSDGVSGRRSGNTARERAMNDIGEGGRSRIRQTQAKVAERGGPLLDQSAGMEEHSRPVGVTGDVGGGYGNAAPKEFTQEVGARTSGALDGTPLGDGFNLRRQNLDRGVVKSREMADHGGQLQERASDLEEAMRKRAARWW